MIHETANHLAEMNLFRPTTWVRILRLCWCEGRHQEIFANATKPDYIFNKKRFTSHLSSTHIMAEKKIKLIIDTDPGFDDAMAIAAAIKWPNVEILAITCVSGNVSCSKACINALKIRKVFGGEDIPVYKGAESPIYSQVEHRATHWHGIDGLLDVTDHITVDEKEIEEKHAVNSIIDIATKHKGEVTLLAIGPLTNLSLAVKMKPDLPKYLKEVVILGGNYTGLGNQTRTGEFNFVADPLAAHIVLEEYTCPVYVVPWETVLSNPFSDGFVSQYTSKDNDRSNFFKLIINAHSRRHSIDLTDSADTLAIGVALDKDKVIAEKLHTHATVEPFGVQTCGMMVVERRHRAHKWHGEPTPNVFVVTKVNIEKVEEMLINSIL